MPRPDDPFPRPSPLDPGREQDESPLGPPVDLEGLAPDELAAVAVPLADTPPRRPVLRLALIAVVGLLVLGGVLAAQRSGFRLPGTTDDSSAVEGAVSPEEQALEDLLADVSARAMEHVLLQLDHEPTYPSTTWPDMRTPWGHVPEFTLFDDGTVVYLANAAVEPPRLTWAMLSAESLDELTGKVRELGFDRLESYEPHERQAADGTIQSVDNSVTTIMRVRVGGELRTVRTYHDFTNDPDAFYAINDFLVGWEALELDTGEWPADGGLYGGGLKATVLLAPETGMDPTALEVFAGGNQGVVVWPTGAPLPHLDGALALSDEELDFAEGAVEAWLADVGAAQLQGPYPSTTSLDFFNSTRDLLNGYWAWPFEFDTEDRYAVGALRLVFVPWIYPSYDHRDDLARVEAARAALRQSYQVVEATPAPPSPLDLVLPVPTESVEYPFPPEVQAPRLEAQLGIQTWRHWWSYGSWEQLDHLKSSGFGVLKQRFAWKDMELAPGEIDWVHADYYLEAAESPYYVPMGSTVDGTSIEPWTQASATTIVQLDVPPDWARSEGDDPFDLEAWRAFVHAFAARYSGRVAAYEIMNEPNLAREWGGPPDPAAYARVLTTAFEAIKTADPNAVVISAGLAPTGDQMPEAMADDTFLLGLYDAIEASVGTTDLAFDALGAHAPGFRAAPSISPEVASTDAELGGERFFTFRRVEDLRAIMVERGDDEKQVVVTEFGWTTDRRPDSPYSWSAVSTEVRSAFIGQATDYALEYWSPWIGPLVLFSAGDPAWTPDDEAYWWSVTDEEGYLTIDLAR